MTPQMKRMIDRAIAIHEVIWVLSKTKTLPEPFEKYKGFDERSFTTFNDKIMFWFDDKIESTRMVAEMLEE